MNRLASHPRLFWREAECSRLQASPRLSWLKRLAAAVLEAADGICSDPAVRYDASGHNALLIRARQVQTRVLTLLAVWLRTGEEAYRQATLAYVRQMRDWSHWSWIALRHGDDEPDAIFDLSYGENCATLAMAYDVFYNSLTKGERAVFLDTARRWAFPAGERHCRPGGAWWFGKPDSNWNTVCAGGLGMLCLAMFEDDRRCRTLLSRADASIRPFVELTEKTGGGWPEGIGYWNYGMQYLFTYLLSHEAAAGCKHPLLSVRGLKKTLSFPLDFTPFDEGCSFGDVNRWTPLPTHLAMARRLGARDVEQELWRRFSQQESLPALGAWGMGANLLALAVPPARPARKPAGRNRGPRAVFYPGLDWGVLADRWPKPRLYLSVRGGTTQVPHSHRDLLSFHCVVEGERLIENVGPSTYLDSTFSSRRGELFEMAPASKNTLLINGVGICDGGACERTHLVRQGNRAGIRLVATAAMGTSRDGVPAASFCGRLVLLLRSGAALILDRVMLPFPGCVEARLHTRGLVKALRHGAQIRGASARLRVSFAANQPAVMGVATSTPTLVAQSPCTVLRWGTERRDVTQYLSAILLTSGTGAARVVVEPHGRGFAVRVETRSRRETVVVSEKLMLRKAKR